MCQGDVLLREEAEKGQKGGQEATRKSGCPGAVVRKEPGCAPEGNARGEGSLGAEGNSPGSAVLRPYLGGEAGGVSGASTSLWECGKSLVGRELGEDGRVGANVSVP